MLNNMRSEMFTVNLAYVYLYVEFALISRIIVYVEGLFKSSSLYILLCLTPH